MKTTLYPKIFSSAIFALAILASSASRAQVAYNNTILWLRADAGVTKNASNIVSAWASQRSTNGVVTPQILGTGAATYQDPTTYSSTTFFNYNPSFSFNNKYIEFSNTDANTLVSSMTQANLFYAFRINLDNVDNLAQNAWGEIHNFSNGTSSANGGAVNYFVPFPGDYSTGIQYFDDFGAKGTASAYNRQSMLLNNYADMKLPVIYNVGNQLTTGSTYQAFNFLNSESVSGTGTQTTTTAPDYHGNGSDAPLSIFNGSLAAIGSLNCAATEILLIDAALTVPERRNVASYLAIKNGVTLDQTTAYNYTSSSSTAIPWASTGTLVNNDIIWNATTNTAYKYNIIGIGRDALSAPLVNQKQSRSVNTANKGNLISISTRALATNNTSNTTAIAALPGINSFFMVADNGEAAHSGGPSGSGTTGPNPVSNTEMPAGVQSRIYREWLTDATNYVQNVVIGFDLSMIGNSSSFTNLRLLTDADGDFTNATIESFTPTMNPNYPTMVEFIVPVTSYGLRPYFTLASISTATTLPVELISFNADCNDGTAELNWKLASEHNNSYFTLEGSNDAVAFNKIADVKSYGNTINGSEYNYELINSRYDYFRLSQTDTDGTQTKLGLVNSDCGSNDFSVEFYPNPVAADDELNLYVNSTRTDIINVSFYDLTGKLCGQETIEVRAGTTLTKVPVAQLSKGIYVVKCKSEFNEIPAMRLIKE